MPGNIFNRLARLEATITRPQCDECPEAGPRLVLIYPDEGSPVTHWNGEGTPRFRTKAEARTAFPGQELQFIVVVYTEQSGIVG